MLVVHYISNSCFFGHYLGFVSVSCCRCCFFFFILHLNDRSFVVTLACFTYICTKKEKKSRDKSRTSAFRSVFIVELCALWHSKHCWRWNLESHYLHWNCTPNALFRSLTEQYTRCKRMNIELVFAWLIMPYVFAFQHKHNENGKLYTDRNVYL